MGRKCQEVDSIVLSRVGGPVDSRVKGTDSSVSTLQTYNVCHLTHIVLVRYSNFVHRLGQIMSESSQGY